YERRRPRAHGRGAPSRARALRHRARARGRAAGRARAAAVVGRGAGGMGEHTLVATRRTAAPARAAVIPFPGLQARAVAHRLVPSSRSVLVALALLLCAGAAYLVARETSLFAIRTVRVEGAPPGIAREVGDIARTVQGESLLRLDGGALLRRLRALPDVASVHYDRAFPHTLRLVVTPERPVAVLRQGHSSWIVS